MTDFNQEDWEDVTKQIFELTKTLKLLEVAREESFSLQDGMIAHEVNDDKIDPKHDIKQQFTISYMLKHNQIKLPKELSLEEILGIYGKVLKHEAMILKSYPLPQTIYTFTYLFDQNIYADHEYIRPLVESINALGSYIYQLHKQSCSLKDDDLGLSTFSYSTRLKSHDQIAQLLLKNQQKLSEQLKKQKQSQKKKIYEQLIDFIKLRRSTHLLVKSMGNVYDNKHLNKIQNDIHAAQKVIASLEQKLKGDQSYFQDQYFKGTGIYSQTIYKTLRTHFGPRQIPSISIKQSINQIKNALTQFKLIIPIPNRMCLLCNNIETLSRLPLNLWSKSYIKNNMFKKQDYIFSTLKTSQLIVNDINDFTALKEDVKLQKKFTQLITLSCPVISEALFRLLGRTSRSFWQLSRLYEDFNVLIHLANQVDTLIFPPNKKQLFISCWFYRFGINCMISQVFSGIQNDIYLHDQYAYVLYQLESLLGVYDRNSGVFLKRFDKQYIQSFYNGNLTQKKKKKTAQASRKFHSDSLFKKGLHFYVRSLHRIIFILVNRKLIDNPFEQTLQTRIQKRFKIFKSVYFVRNISYEQYMNDFKIICGQQKGYLDQALQLLKEAKNIFQQFQKLQESDCFYQVKAQAQRLVKICVKCSLVVMSLKMNQKKKFIIRNQDPKYPEVLMQ